MMLSFAVEHTLISILLFIVLIVMSVLGNRYSLMRGQ